MQSKYPNLIKIRALITELEVLIRNELRRYFKTKLGEQWEHYVSEQRRAHAVKWKAVAERKGSSYDLLDGATLGELINLASSERYFFRKQFFDEKIVVKNTSTSLSISGSPK